MSVVTISGSTFFDQGVAITSGYGPQFRGCNDSVLLPCIVDSGASGCSVGYSGNFYTAWSSISNAGLDTSDLNSVAQYGYDYGTLMKKLGLNLLRTGAQEKWAANIMYSNWAADPTLFYQTVQALVCGLYHAGVYTLVQLFGVSAQECRPSLWPSGSCSTSDNGAASYEVGTLSSNGYSVPTSGSIPTNNPLNVGSSSYDHLVSYCAACAQNLYGTPGLIGVEMCNEPEMWSNMYDWWGPQSGTACVESNSFVVPYNSAAASMVQTWANSLASAVKSTAGSSRASIGIGFSTAQWSCPNGWNSGAGYVIGSAGTAVDFGECHIYYPCGDNSAVTDQSTFQTLLGTIASSMGKAFIVSEWGPNAVEWSSTMDAAFNGAGVNNCVMSLSGMSGYPPAQQSFGTLASGTCTSITPPAGCTNPTGANGTTACIDGYTNTCNGTTWVASTSACCTADITETCQYGPSPITTYNCVNGVPVATGNVCGCAPGTTQDCQVCSDGTVACTSQCSESYIWEPTGDVCAAPFDYMLLVPVFVGLPLAALGIMMYAKKKH